MVNSQSGSVNSLSHTRHFGTCAKQRFPFHSAAEPVLEILLNESELAADFDARDFNMAIQRSFRHLQERCRLLDR
jgi:hypothetical protein